MQRVEFKLIYFPEDHQWRLYSGNDYRCIRADMTDLHKVVCDSLNGLGTNLQQMGENILLSNPNLFTEPK